MNSFDEAKVNRRGKGHGGGQFDTKQNTAPADGLERTALYGDTRKDIRSAVSASEALKHAIDDIRELRATDFDAVNERVAFRTPGCTVVIERDQVARNRHVYSVAEAGKNFHASMVVENDLATAKRTAVNMLTAGSKPADREVATEAIRGDFERMLNGQPAQLGYVLVDREDHGDPNIAIVHPTQQAADAELNASRNTVDRLAEEGADSGAGRRVGGRGGGHGSLPVR